MMKRDGNFIRILGFIIAVSTFLVSTSRVEAGLGFVMVLLCFILAELMEKND